MFHTFRSTQHGRVSGHQRHQQQHPRAAHVRGVSPFPPTALRWPHHLHRSAPTPAVARVVTPAASNQACNCHHPQARSRPFCHTHARTRLMHGHPCFWCRTPTPPVRWGGAACQRFVRSCLSSVPQWPRSLRSPGWRPQPRSPTAPASAQRRRQVEAGMASGRVRRAGCLLCPALCCSRQDSQPHQVHHGRHGGVVRIVPPRRRRRTTTASASAELPAAAAAAQVMVPAAAGLAADGLQAR